MPSATVVPQRRSAVPFVTSRSTDARNFFGVFAFGIIITFPLKTARPPSLWTAEALSTFQYSAKRSFCEKSSVVYDDHFSPANTNPADKAATTNVIYFFIAPILHHPSTR